MREFTYTDNAPFEPDPAGMAQILRLLAECARKSPDPSTQNAAAAVRDLRGPYPQAACFHNGPPFPVADLTDRDYKLAVSVHAEERVCLNAALTSDLVALWAACPQCARGIVERGFIRVWTLDMPCPERWKPLVDLGSEILARGGVKRIIITPHVSLGVSWRHNGQEYKL